MTDESCVSEVQDNAVSQDLGQASRKAAIRTGWDDRPALLEVGSCLALTPQEKDVK